VNGADWRLDREDGLAVMRFGLLEERGIRHGLVVRDQGRILDDEQVYRVFSARVHTAVTEQTHSTRAALITAGSGLFYPERVRADALMSKEPGLRLTIHTADCVPVFLAAADGRAVGLFHCGWRGTADGFLGKAVRMFAMEYRVGPEELLSVIGPCIEAGCYPVGAEVAERFGEDVKRPAPGGRWLLDLRAENERQLSAAGLKPENCQVAPLCTRCRRELFHSYRREGAGLGGKMVAFIEAGHEEDRN
jgi:hypothetical protein